MQYDLIIIGGGVNGCGILRDATLRGLKCLLLERNDFGSETTGASSQMIHGGARYLFSDRKTTRLSSLDSGYIQKIAGHMLFRIPFLVPVFPKSKWPRWMSRVYFELMETFFENYDRFAGMKNSHTHTRLSREQALELEPDLAEDLLGAVSFDEWGIDGARLIGPEGGTASGGFLGVFELAAIQEVARIVIAARAVVDTAVQRIVARAALKIVLAQSARQPVVAVRTVQSVIVRPTIERIVPRAADQGVATIAPQQHIVTKLSAKRVIAAVARHRVVAVAAGQMIAVLSTRQNVIAAAAQQIVAP